MKVLNDVATGAICGAFGFFGGKMGGIPFYSQMICSLGVTLAFNATLYRHPYFKPDEYRVIAMTCSAIATLAIGWSLKYGLGLPDYATHSVVICLALFSSFVASAFNQEIAINPIELRELLRIIVDMTLPESRLRRLVLEPV